MKIFAETERIFLREIVPGDADAMFEMDADPLVHTYLGKSPVSSVDQSVAQIRYIRQQYADHGIGRWAIIAKETNEFVGWGGLKFRTDEVNGHVNFYDVGYRLLRQHWGKGFATESAKASLKYAFEILKTDAVYAMAHIENKASIHALQKSGLRITAQLEFDGIPCYWFEIKKEDWK